MPTQLTACFNGCSFTFGEGFPENQRDHYIYDRLLSKQFGLDSKNISIGGSSNYTIFMRSAAAIMSQTYDIVFTQWSALNRMWLFPGPDSQFFLNDNKNKDFIYREIQITASQLQQIKDTLLMLNHDYHNIFDLIDYCAILEHLAQLNSVKIVFINGLVPWQQDLNNPANKEDLDRSLSDYTKFMLDFDNRSDDEIILFFSNLQRKFTKLNQSLWVNLFNSFQHNTVDHGPEGHHPGIKSHQWMADKISNFLITEKLL